MSYYPAAAPTPKRNRFTCITCLLLALIACACLALLVFVAPIALQKLGLFGPDAREVYELAPDPVASRALEGALVERGIAGVSVYVIPIKGQPTQGAFIILDASQGYTGLSPLDDDDQVLTQLLQDLAARNREQNLRISHLTVEYRDQSGAQMLAFTADMADVDAYAGGQITRETFFSRVNFNILETFQNLGIDQLLQEVLP